MKHTKFLSLLLGLALCLTLFTPALAAEDGLNYPITEGSSAQECADYLYVLGLFNGAGVNADGTPIYDLEAAPTRAQGVTMLVRLIGKGGEAEQGAAAAAPFTDVPDWAKAYINYAYSNGLTTGRDETTFDPDTPISASEYLTLALRALGYDSSKDFSWDAPWKLADKLGLSAAGTYDISSRTFTRGDVAVISARALAASLKGDDATLLESLIEKKAVDRVYFLDTVLTSAVNELYLSFSPMFASPETYASFTVDSVTANGVSCTVKQYSTPKEVAAYFAGASEGITASLAPSDAFALAGLQYDEKAASDAATRFYTEDFGEGETYDYPIIDFQFTCTGVLADGSTVQESFTRSFHMDAYDGPLRWF